MTSALNEPKGEDDRADAQGNGRQLGVRLAEQCLANPGLLRAFFAQIKRALDAGHYSTAFKSCVLDKLRQVPAAEIMRLVTDPATAGTRAKQLGQNAAQACIASGVQP